MTEREVMAELVRYVGVLTYGKERWFKQNGCWYDRAFGDHIQNEVLLERIRKAIENEVRCDSADRPTGKWEIKTETDEYGLKRPKLVCSKCEKEPAAWDLTELFDFCPNCGAKMGGDTE